MRTLYEALVTIYQHAESHMPIEALESVASKLTNEAETTARNLSEIMEGMSSLVLEDGGNETPTGCFQDAQGVFPLLWGMAQQFDHIAALIRIGDDARVAARNRMLASRRDAS